MDIGKKIKHLRSESGYSQERFAEATGIPLGTLRNVESKNNPTWEQLSKILALPELRRFTLWLMIDETAPSEGQLHPDEVYSSKKISESPINYSTSTTNFRNFINELAELTEKYKQ